MILLYLLAGSLTGFLAGLLGTGGGIIVVPLSHYLFSYDAIPEFLNMHMAVGTSLTVMIFTSLSSAIAFNRKKLIEWNLFYQFIPGLLIGTCCGALFANLFDSGILKISFALFLIFLAFYLLFFKSFKSGVIPPRKIILITCTFFIGILSGFFGIGGGSMLVPLMIYYHTPMHKAIGTTAMLIFPIALMGSLAFILLGLVHTNHLALPREVIGYVNIKAALLMAITSVIFAPVGATLSAKLPSTILSGIFAFILLITAANLILF